MDWATILTEGLKILGSLAATIIITLSGILYSKFKKSLTESRVSTYLKTLVKAAEQLYPNLGNKTGKEKYEYVKNLVLEKFTFLTDNEHLKALIEGAVFALNEEFDKQTEQVEKTNTPDSTLLIS